MDFIEPLNYETIPKKVEAFVVPDFNELIDDKEKCDKFLDEVNKFISTTYFYAADLRTLFDKKTVLYIHCGVEEMYAFPGSTVLKYESGGVDVCDEISFPNKFRRV